MISQAALMVGPTLGQRRDDSADVGPALGQRLGRPSMLSGIVVSVFCFVLFCYQLVVCFFVASPVSDTILSDNKWAKFSFAELLYVRCHEGSCYVTVMQNTACWVILSCTIGLSLSDIGQYSRGIVNQVGVVQPLWHFMCYEHFLITPALRELLSRDFHVS